MKKIFYLLLAAGLFLFISCKKEKTTPATDTATVKYEFVTDRNGNFSVEYSTDSTQATEFITSASWSKEITINKNNTQSNTIQFVVHPPFEWTTTTDQANVTISVYVDGTLRSSKSGILGGVDHPAGLTINTDL